ncbi:hypothetical protein LPJ75_005208 [Coemansia sp. RSA 2598]|nr:hypothetical protein LPJ75_005208 [Coemansia sp. RSA 2598]
MTFRQMQRETTNEFSNTPPLSPIRELDDAYFGMAYSQRYRRQTHDSNPDGPNMPARQTSHRAERRARHIPLEAERFPLIVKAAQKMADIFNIKNPLFFCPWLSDEKDAIGENGAGRLDYREPSSDRVLKRRHRPLQETGTSARAAARSRRGPFVADADSSRAHEKRSAILDRDSGIECDSGADGLCRKRRCSVICSCTLAIKGSSSAHQKLRPQLVVIERVGNMYAVKPQHSSCQA